MYLVVITVERPAGVNLTSELLQHAVYQNAVGTDSLQHAYIETRGDRIGFCLYVQAPGRSAAISAAIQLYHRTMGTIAHSNHWTL